MAKQVILKGKVVANDWQIVANDQTDVPAGAAIVPFSYWSANRAALAARADLGVWFDSDELPAADDYAALAALPLIAVNFPVFTDGRGFSIARILRERAQFHGELRAIGYVLRDQLCFMKRCGFTSFDLPEGKDLAAAIESLDDFTEYYQGAVDVAEPLFRRA